MNAAGRPGIRADLIVVDADHRVDLGPVATRHRDVERGAETDEAVLAQADDDRGGDGGFPDRRLALARDAQQGVLEAGGVAGREELLGIRGRAIQRTKAHAGRLKT